MQATESWLKLIHAIGSPRLMSAASREKTSGGEPFWLPSLPTNEGFSPKLTELLARTSNFDLDFFHLCHDTCQPRDAFTDRDLEALLRRS